MASGPGDPTLFWRRFCSRWVTITVWIIHMSQQMNHSSITWFLEERLHESIRRKSRVAELQAVAQAENDEIGSTNSINSINSTNYIQGLYQFNTGLSVFFTSQFNQEYTARIYTSIIIRVFGYNNIFKVKSVRLVWFKNLTNWKINIEVWMTKLPR